VTLNPDQLAAIHAWNEALLVMAPVGTGKTNVLALRAAHAIENGVPPSEILCLSFTNKAARELKARLTTVLGKTANAITAKTFHGLCAAILRAEAPAVGWDRDFIVYDEEDCRTLCGDAAHRFGISLPKEDKTQFEFLLFQAAGDARLSPYENPPGLNSQLVFDRAVQSSRLENLKRRKIIFPPILIEYVHLLRERHAVDFADLIHGLNKLFSENPGILQRYQKRFSWIQIDEVQDTNRSEYLPLRLLAEPHKRLSFFGDVDQTIYQWRGSVPHDILCDYRARFAPVREIRFTRNYRSTRRIIAACEKLIQACPDAVTREIIPQSADDGLPPECYAAADIRDEARWIASRICELHRGGSNYGDIAVLTRTNFTARDLSREFTALKLPHLKVDEFKFFQRAEIKDALAHLKLLVNPHDTASLTRFLKTPPKGIGDATIEALKAAPRDAGLKIGDLLDPAIYEAGDPFLRLTSAARDGRVVVFDIETTGLRIGDDDIVEIAATKCGANSTGESFHAYLKPGKPVGDSEPIHHLSDAFLAEHGQDPRDVLERFRHFCDGCVLAGHNIPLFDVPFLRGACARLGLPDWQDQPAFDTLDLTRRFYRFSRYRLGDICQKLGLKSVPTHRADADVAATVELLQVLLPKLEEGLTTRLDAVKKHGARFKPLAAQVSTWRRRMAEERPHELLDRIYRESGLLRYYEEDEERFLHLKELLDHFERFDDPGLAPVDALLHVLSVASLAREIDGQKITEDQVLLLTVHQAKGLEFDNVFVAGACEGEFPNRRSLREGLELEEHRLFYVAISRAKQRLFFSYPLIDTWGRETIRSRYLRHLAPLLEDR